MTTNHLKICVNDLSHSFASPTSAGPLPVLQRVSFQVAENELVALVGPSGCGKTTVLRALAGLLHPSEGVIRMNGGLVVRPSPERILVFQDLHLFHWMTVAGNVGFALTARGVRGRARRRLTLSFLELVGLTEFADYYPQALSGGMKQRLALARALAGDPEVLLMDEPFGSLDVQSRIALESEFLSLIQTTKVTIVLVTHDVRQAIFLADRILVMSSRPGTVLSATRVPFDRPRKDSIRNTPEFNALEEQISKSIGTGESSP